MDSSQPTVPQQKGDSNNFSSDSQQQVCILAKNLDSGQVTQIDLQKLDIPLQKLSSRKKSAWEEYWEQRQEIKNYLFKVVNNNKEQDLLALFQNTNQDIDLNQYVYMDGWSLLHQAVNRKLFDIALILINKGCNVNAITQSMHRTPLHLAVLQHNQEIVELLLTFGASPNIVDVDLCSPVHYASQFGYVSIIKIFLEKCENINLDLKNIKKQRVIDCCRDARIRSMINDYRIVHCLESEQADQSINRSNDNKGHFIRTRSHFIERILNQSNKVSYSSCQQIQNAETDIIKISKKQSTISSLGSKISKQKLERFNLFAKKSLQSFKDSQNQGTIESIQNYDLIRQLGSGSFGTVFLIRKKKSSKLFALKRLSKKLIIENRMKKYAFAERQILKNVKHPFILHGYSFFQDHAFLYMVMDFCAGGDLEKCVRKNKFDEEKAKKYCCQVVLAIEELHRRNYLFRDLKVSNVLLDETGHVKLADFGLAKQSQMSHSFLGSVAYLAPEMLVDTANKPHTAAIDWYLLGVFVYEMIVGVPPFFNENRIQMFESIKKQKPRIPSNLTPQCKDFLIKTLAKRPNQRLGHGGAKQIKSHNWFNGVNWSTVLQRKLDMQIPQINQKQLRSRQYMEQAEIETEKRQQNNFRGWDYFQGQKN